MVKNVFEEIEDNMKEFANGAGDLNDTTASCGVNKTGETTRINSTCAVLSENGNMVKYNCSIEMQFYDAENDWTINCSVKDNTDVNTENLSFTTST